MKDYYEKTLLPNGLRVVTERIPQFRSASLGIWVDVGSADEDDSNRGVSHFLEHLMFKGTPTHTARDIAEIVDGIGGNLNAFTEKEHTCFYVKVMDKHVPLAMKLMGEMLCNSSFPEEEVEKEKGVILEEIKMYEDSPDELIFDLIAQAAWENHPLGEPILGTAASVLAVTRQMLLNFVKKFYTPDRIVIAAAGKVKHENIVKLAQECFPFPHPLGGAKPHAPPPHFVTTRVVRYKETEQVHLCLVMDGISQHDERRYALSVLDTIVGGSVSSRLFQEIREKRGLAYTISSFGNAYAKSALFGVYGALGASNFTTVSELVVEILNQIKTKGITRKEFLKAKEHLKGSVSLTFESTSNRMIRLAKSELYHNRFITNTELLKKIQELKLDEVQALAQSVLNLNACTWGILGPVREEVKVG